MPKLKMFLNFNTDEVFGPAELDSWEGFCEDDVHNPKNPYAATKSAAGQMVNAFANTYYIPCVETFTMNVFGQRQHPEKFIPLCIRAAITGDTVNIHSTPDRTQAGVRSYIDAKNVGAALNWIVDNLNVTPQYVARLNIVGEQEVDNLTLAKMIDEIVGALGPKYGYKPAGLKYELVDFHSSRPGHDLAYRLDGSRLKYSGFTYPSNFEKSLRDTVKWYLENGKV
jgi:dTDP-glucose 4,6-dehydratase